MAPSPQHEPVPGTGSGSEIVRFDKVGVRFGGETVFENLSFTIRAGECVCLLGPTGCGKSTALRLIGDLCSASAGSIDVAGATPRQSWDKVAYVFRSSRLFPWRTALGNVVMGMEARGLGLTLAEIRATARAHLELVGLGRLTERYPLTLSAGERQRVAIARALSVNPLVLVMDEPFSALDGVTRGQLRADFLKIQEKTGITIVFATHSFTEAWLMADRILVLAARPTRIRETIAIDVPRPRRIDDGDGRRRLQRYGLVTLSETMHPLHGMSWRSRLVRHVDGTVRELSAFWRTPRGRL